MADRELSLQEEFLLLCLNDETGTFECRWIHHGLAAAALGELLLRDRLALDAHGLVHLKDAAPTGDAALDRALARVVERPTAALSLYLWVNTLADQETFEQILLPRLIERSILRKDKGGFLIFFRQPTYPTLSPAPEQRLRQQIREAISGSEIANERLAVLISLLHYAEDRRSAEGGALRFVFTPDELQHHQERIAAIADSTPISRTLGRALQDAITVDSEHPRAGH